MKKLIILAGVAAFITLTAFTTVHTDIYKVDKEQSKLVWLAEKVSGKHNGTVNLSNGEIRDDHGTYSGNFEVDMKSIQNKDIESPEYKTKLENHLKSADFFDVEKYPVAKFFTTSVTPVTAKDESGFTHHIKGKLTIKDKTNDLEFDAIIKMQEEKLVCSGTAIVDRSKFDVKYGSKTFYEDIGDKMINDNFTLQIRIVGVK